MKATTTWELFWLSLFAGTGLLIGAVLLKAFTGKLSIHKKRAVFECGLAANRIYYIEYFSSLTY
jgi:hypothetical protein